MLKLDAVSKDVLCDQFVLNIYIPISSVKSSAVTPVPEAHCIKKPTKLAPSQAERPTAPLLL